MKIRGLWLVVPWAIFVALALAWVFYWNYLAGEAERRVHAFTADQTAHGATVSVTRIVRHGFPVLMRLELDGVSYAPARGGWRISTQRADLNIDVLNPQHVILESQAPIAVVRPDATTNVTADKILASLRTDRGALAVAGIEADNLVLDDPAQQGQLHVQKVVANLRPDPRAAGQYQLAFDATALTLPRPVRSFEPFGLDVPVLSARIVVEQGAALLRQTDPDDPLAAWRTAGGKLRFEGLELRWGPLRTTGTGEGSLDDQRRLQGRLVLPIHHPAPVLLAIADGQNVDRDARRALQLLAAGYLVTGHEVTLDVGAANGVLSIEGLPVRQLPPVYGAPAEATPTSFTPEVGAAGPTPPRPTTP